MINSTESDKSRGRQKSFSESVSKSAEISIFLLTEQINRFLFPVIEFRRLPSFLFFDDLTDHINELTNNFQNYIWRNENDAKPAFACEAVSFF